MIKSAGILGNPVRDEGKPYVVLGAGIAGLMTGFWLKQRGIDFTILEKTDRAGGLLRTSQTAYGPVESAANGFLWCRAMQDICDELDLEVLPPSPEASRRFIVRNGKLRTLPLRLTEILPLIFRVFTPADVNARTVGEFSNQIFGSAFTKYLTSPGLSGIYGADPSELGFESIMSGVQQAFRQHRIPAAALYSFARQKKAELKSELEGEQHPRGTHSFPNGMQELVDALAHYLRDHLKYGTDAADFSPHGKSVISTLPAHVNARWLSAHHHELSLLMTAVHYNSMISVTAFFKLQEIPDFKPGFGCLIPRSEGFSYLGILFNHCIFSGRSENQNGSFTAILRDDENLYRDHTSDQMAQLLKEDMLRLFGQCGEPINAQVHRWPRGIPLYSPELSVIWPRIDSYLKAELPGLRVFGNYTGEISIRGMATTLKAAIR